MKVINNVEYDDNMKKLIKYPENKQDEYFEIPYGIEAISVEAFKNNKFIKNISFPDTLKYINQNAFDGCISIEEIVLSDNITHLRSQAFKGCTSLNKITLSKKLRFFDEGGIFLDCNNLEKIIISDNKNFIVINNVLFTNDLKALVYYPIGCKEESYEIPDGTEKINNYAFSTANYLKHVIIPNTVNNIEPNVFSCCENLESVEIEDGCNFIGFGMFSYCSNLKFIKLPDSIKYISERSFVGCKSLESFYIPKNIEIIEQGAFELSALSSVGKFTQKQQSNLSLIFKYNNVNYCGSNIDEMKNLLNQINKSKDNIDLRSFFSHLYLKRNGMDIKMKGRTTTPITTY